MPTAQLGAIELYYDTFGDPEDPTILLVPGLGTQVLFWEEEFCQGLVDRAFHVIRVDNRDVGLSTKLSEHPVDMAAAFAALGEGQAVDAPYSVHDMATDLSQLIDHLDLGPLHILGCSLGGMIAQELAAAYPHQVKTLALLSSTTGAADVGQPAPEALAALTQPGAVGREAIIEQNVTSRQIWSTEAHWDEHWTRDYFTRAYDRAPESTSARQLLAVLTAADREDALRGITIPTTVFHGDADLLINPNGGERLAELLPDCEHVVLEGMSHDLPPHYWSQVIEGLVRLAIRSL